VEDAVDNVSKAKDDRRRADRIKIIIFILLIGIVIFILIMILIGYLTRRRFRLG